MSLSLSNLKTSTGKRRPSRRLGRGNASGRGTYSGRGIKGQKARAGGRGGLKRLGMRRLLLNVPKVGGFKSLYPRPAVLNVGDLEKLTSGAEVNPKSLIKIGLIKSAGDGIKILGDGKLTKKLMIKGCQVSESARKKIIEAGGEVK